MSTYASFQGRVFLGKRDESGLPIEVRSPGNVAELKLSLKTDVLEHYESQTGQRSLDHRMVKQKSATVNLTIEEFTKGLDPISADIVLCRVDRALPEDMKKKIALFCNVDPRQVIAARDVPSIYEVPLMFCREGLDDILLELLTLPHYDRDLSRWESLVARVKNPHNRVRVGIVGKYVEFPDSYKSLNEALIHGGIANEAKVELVYVSAEEIETGNWPREILEVDGLLVPIGLGSSGNEGKIRAIR